MDNESPEWTQKNALKMFSGSRSIGSGCGGRRKQKEVLSGMIVWNVFVLVLLLLAVCVQGQGGAMSSDTSSHLALRRSAQGEVVKKESPDGEKSAKSPTPLSQSAEDNVSQQSKDSQVAPNTGEKDSEGGGGGGGDAQPTPENSPGSANATTEGGSHPSSHLNNMSTEAVLRGFYVFVGVGAIILIYIIIKLARLRKRRAPGKYRVLSHTDDQEMFPLAAGEGEDEEIFNAAHHQPRK